MERWLQKDDMNSRQRHSGMEHFPPWQSGYDLLEKSDISLALALG
jgi:hypothetical protein